MTARARARARQKVQPNFSKLQRRDHPWQVLLKKKKGLD